MTRPALARFGIGAVLAIGLTSCGTVEPELDPGVVGTDNAQDIVSAPASPNTGEDGMPGGYMADKPVADDVAADDTGSTAGTAADGSKAGATGAPDSPTANATSAGSTGSATATAAPAGADDGASTGPTEPSEPSDPKAPPTPPDPIPTPAPIPTGIQPSPSPPQAGLVDGLGISQGADFTTYSDRAMAITYNPQLVPVGATINLVRQHGVDATSMSVAVAGLVPNHGYAAHVHMDACGITADAAGPSYRNNPALDPVSGIVNTENEIWLELTTGAYGTAQSSTTVGWPIRPGEGYSLIIHAEVPGAGDTGVSEQGERVACFVLARP